MPRSATRPQTSDSSDKLQLNYLKLDASTELEGSRDIAGSSCVCGALRKQRPNT
jgi:hypothetical protein